MTYFDPQQSANLQAERAFAAAYARDQQTDIEPQDDVAAAIAATYKHMTHGRHCQPQDGCVCESIQALQAIATAAEAAAMTPEVIRLREALVWAQPALCSVYCPSQWNTADYPEGRPHVTRCIQARAALEGTATE